MVRLKDTLPRQAASRVLLLKIAAASHCCCLNHLQAAPGDYFKDIRDATGLLALAAGSGLSALGPGWHGLVAC